MKVLKTPLFCVYYENNMKQTEADVGLASPFALVRD